MLIEKKASLQLKPGAAGIAKLLFSSEKYGDHSIYFIKHALGKTA